jgi:uncharacterized protein with ParB-like and HNH nuclease domain
MAELKLKTINSLLGESFFVPDYQRGYRWTERNVRDLLDDIWGFTEKPSGKFYCLQPLAVKKRSNENRWSVVDGQQRITTVFIILKYLMKEYLKTETLSEDYGKDIYNIAYATRGESEIFLKDISSVSVVDKRNIDYYYMSEAYLVVKEWFSDNTKVKDRTDREKFLSTLLGKEKDELSVQVIWYEVDDTENEVKLFSRLNIGKIPLTNSELIKALFLSSSSFVNDNESDIKKKEISLLWDKMEQELSDEDFWAFISNENLDDYDSKIELLFNTYVGKDLKRSDPLFTFLEFRKAIEAGNDLWETWLRIERFYETLREWYIDRELYHKIGFLVSTGTNLNTLLHESDGVKKDAFKDSLHQKIAAKFANTNIDDLEYGTDNANAQLHKVFMLFNIESILQSADSSERYPFKAHKKEDWSLEHIHAQSSESLTKEEQWREWLDYHHKSLCAFPDNEKAEPLLLEAQTLLERPKISKVEFTSVSNMIIKFFTLSEGESSESDPIHGIGNLALLGRDANSVLNNSVFEVKRRKIIEMDMAGIYIPICTRRLFLKYYTLNNDNETTCFWSNTDRKHYIDRIKTVLGKYLDKGNDDE